MMMTQDEKTDVAEALAGLESAQETTKADHILDFGPSWYAPIYAFGFAAGATSLADHAGTWLGVAGSQLLVVLLGIGLAWWSLQRWEFGPTFAFVTWLASTALVFPLRAVSSGALGRHS